MKPGIVNRPIYVILILALIAALVLLIVVGIGIERGEAPPSVEPSAAPSAEPSGEPLDVPAQEPFFAVDVDGGYALTLALCTERGYAASTTSSVVDYEIVDRTDYVFPITLDGADAGEVRLSLVTDGAVGTLYFLESDADIPVELRLGKDGSFAAPTLRTITYGTASINLVGDVTAGEYDSETSLYIETDGLYVKTGRTVKLTELESTVHSLEPHGAGASFDASDGFVLTQRIAAGDAGFAATHGALCTAPLVDWSIAYRGAKAVSFDAVSDNLALADGFYCEKPADYEPYAYTEGRYIYKTAMSSIHRTLGEPNCGAFLRLMGMQLMYDRIGSYNDEGFVPNPCTSSWLQNDYGIGANFYDTRFNTDAISGLLVASDDASDPLIYETIADAFEFFLGFRAGHGFEAGGAVWVPDYRDASGDIASTHCSLNHYLAEGRALIEAGLKFDRSDWVDAGCEIFSAIDASYELWIRENGDLWYAITTDGEMIKDDYVSVTYNDLVAVVRLLQNGLGALENYPGIRALLASKEEWMRAQGHEQYIQTHP